MTVYPSKIDSDINLPRVDDNITEVGGEAINALRGAVFAIERTLGVNPHGSLESLADRLAVSLNPNGTIKASALTSIGLVTLPIDNAQIGSNAGISESKLALDHGTTELYNLIVDNSNNITIIQNLYNGINTKLNSHINGGVGFRHVASHIDLDHKINDKNGNERSADDVQEAIEEINQALIDHENSVSDAHPAESISVDTNLFKIIPEDATNVQKALEAIDNSEVLVMSPHRTNMHDNGIPRSVRSEVCFDDSGNGQNVVPQTPVKTYLYNPPSISPVDSVSYGDDLVEFVPEDNSDFVFDSQFSQVRVGDAITINYGDGIQAKFLVDEIKYVKNEKWIVRINGTNLLHNTDSGAWARIDRPNFDKNTYSVLATAHANNDLDPSVPSSIIVSSPRGASALGLGFDPTKIDSSHYNLWIQFYPTGNPKDHIINLPPIDVSGNKGTTPGSYTLKSVVHAANDAIRSAGYNLRFIAFSHGGEFGIALADDIGCASFAILSGEISDSDPTILVPGPCVNNIIGDAVDGFDALGFGKGGANIASPMYKKSFATHEQAQLPTKIIVPFRKRTYTVNGSDLDQFAKQFGTSDYWPAKIVGKVVDGSRTVEVTYSVDLDLRASGLAPGKTIIVQPTVGYTDGKYLDADYGRFIIKSVSIETDCDTNLSKTRITVLNGVHGSNTPVTTTSDIGLNVKIYFSSDSVGFNNTNVIDLSDGINNYHRLHEIYINDEGKTFSHERARMPIQNETSKGLATSNWYIRDVSPKLRGFLKEGTNSKFVRFYVVNYNDDTGEYEGYIGMPDFSGHGISKTGIITRAKKNLPARFYDETNVDYVELEFVDKDPSGIKILSDSNSRYIDIEVFPSLQLNKENFLLAVCELSQNKVRYLEDKRQFGNTSEENFTDSAINFITAADRYLHSNGIIEGFDFEKNDGDILYFKGGKAFVDGRVVVANNSSIKIPFNQVSNAGKKYTVPWVVCINKFGNLECVPFNLNLVSKMEIVSDDNIKLAAYTIYDILEKRKDLSIISLCYNIDGIITNEDARRFIINQDINNCFTWVSDKDNQFGSFKSFRALSFWVNTFGNTVNTIKVRGVININSPIEISLLRNVIFEGEGSPIPDKYLSDTLHGEIDDRFISYPTFNITSPTGLKIGGNVTFKNIYFRYNPIEKLEYNNYINYFSDEDSCISIKSIGGKNVKDVKVIDCKFSSPNSKRPPFISVISTPSIGVDGIDIVNCEFIDYKSNDQCAILVSGSGEVANINISNNICNKEQGIYVVDFGAGYYLTPINVKVTNNSCGVIGYRTSNITHEEFPTDARISNRESSLYIEGNNCRLIATVNNNGSIQRSTGFDKVCSNTFINRNNLNYIYVQHINKKNINDNSQSLIISENILSAYDFAWLKSKGSFIASNNAITVDRSNVNTNTPAENCRIVNNKIKGSGSYKYNKGMDIYNSAIIVGNEISGIANVNPERTTDFIQIGATGASAAPLHSVLIQGNYFYRNGEVIDSYVRNNTSGTECRVIDNYFDSSTTGTLVGGEDKDYDLVKGNLTHWIVERNKNQVVSQAIPLLDCINYTNGKLIGSYQDGFYNNKVLISGDPLNGNMYINITKDGTKKTDYEAIYYLNKIIPKNVIITSISVSLRIDELFSDGVLSVGIGDKNNYPDPNFAFIVVEDLDLTNLSLSDGEYKFSITTSPPTYNAGKFNISSTAVLMIWCHNLLVDGSDGKTNNIRIDEIVIKYKW